MPLSSKSTLHCIAGSHGHLSFATEGAKGRGFSSQVWCASIPAGSAAASSVCVCVWHSVPLTLERVFDASSGLPFSACQLLPADRLVEDFPCAVLDRRCVCASLGFLAFQQEALGLSVPVCSSLFISLRLRAIQRDSQLASLPHPWFLKCQPWLADCVPSLAQVELLNSSTIQWATAIPSPMRSESQPWIEAPHPLLSKLFLPWVFSLRVGMFFRVLFY